MARSGSIAVALCDLDVSLELLDLVSDLGELAADLGDPIRILVGELGKLVKILSS